MRAATAALVSVPTVKEENSYAKWFVLAIAVLLVLLAVQVVVAVRRDRRLASERDDASRDDGPARVEDEDPSRHGVDALGDVDDLQVHDHTALTPAPEPDDTGEIETVGDDYEYYADDGDEPEPRRPDNEG
jgi:flagellar biosynthesis/type III secretory pathway M-ring protein FliF/YscJ